MCTYIYIQNLNVLLSNLIEYNGDLNALIINLV